MRKHIEKLEESKINLATFISFSFGFSQALLSYIMSNYFEIASGMKNVGVFYLIAYSIFLVMLLNLHKVVGKFNRSKILNSSIVIKIIVITFLALFPPGWFGIILLIIYIICSSLGWVSLDMILESCSNDSKSERIRGKYLTAMNLGIFLAPFISTQILIRFNYAGIFVALLILNLFILFFESSKVKRSYHDFNSKAKITTVLKKFFRKKNVCRIFYISFALEFFYALMLIYTPIYMLSLGLGWDKIGIIFTFMLTPFLFLQYPVGILADKKTGEKEMLAISVMIMGVAALGIYFIDSTGIMIWSLILFSGRVGAALVEILRDSYFYKRIDGYDVDVIDFFRTARPIAYMVAAILSAIVIHLISIKAVFILIGIVVLLALYPTFYLLDNKSEKDLVKI